MTARSFGSPARPARKHFSAEDPRGPLLETLETIPTSPHVALRMGGAHAHTAAKVGGGMSVAERQSQFFENVKKLVFCTLGINACYLTYGIFQESIFSYRAPDGNAFSETIFLLCVQCFVNCACAGFVLFLTPPGQVQAVRRYAMFSASYVIAMLSSNEALKYVNYPTQALGKSCKMIPVMIFGVLIIGKKYSMREYATVVVITLGISIFNLARMKDGDDSGNSGIGLALLFLSLVMDGITGPSQETLKAECNPSTHQLMFYTNLYAFGYTLVLSIITGQAQSGVAFCLANSDFSWSVFSFSLCSALGQNFIFYTINTFDSLTCTTITTTRKFFTILSSVIWFGHTITNVQWSGVFLVFAGLGAEVQGKYAKHYAKAQEKTTKS